MVAAAAPVAAASDRPSVPMPMPADPKLNNVYESRSDLTVTWMWFNLNVQVPVRQRPRNSQQSSGQGGAGET